MHIQKKKHSNVNIPLTMPVKQPIREKDRMNVLNAHMLLTKLLL